MPAHPIHRTCHDCQQPFVISPDEQRWWAELSQRLGTVMKWPNRCTRCRALQREAQLAVCDDGQGEQLTCIDCGAPFFFGDRDKTFYAARGFARPRRCRPCRHRRSATSTSPD